MIRYDQLLLEMKSEMNRLIMENEKLKKDNTILSEQLKRIAIK